ncbi:DNA-binding transcriptional regulator, MarR family [Asanoa hainanensis]|uniref:DNA-binding transcriptional regulator, MarR family n=1 Tax=Asanoa hainanensis TaxID=560556 RepID=A0A239P3X1_9ACTN|nr:helix-turn-helix domain-containing protein [Asanoa hainanensis]SNT61831.1 DNA-binding transcriptional regulator, MarR family [Asanoa hainanensis]
MTPVEIILLGRTLMKIGEQALPAPEDGTPLGGERTVVIVMSDIFENPGTTVGEVARRTGLPQSAVSGSVARLRSVGSVISEPDPRDRRRQLLARNPDLTARRRTVATTTVDEAVAAALGQHTPTDLTTVLSALETLGEWLTPQTLTRLRPDG